MLCVNHPGPRAPQFRPSPYCHNQQQYLYLSPKAGQRLFFTYKKFMALLIGKKSSWICGQPQVLMNNNCGFSKGTEFPKYKTRLKLCAIFRGSGRGGVVLGCPLLGVYRTSSGDRFPGDETFEDYPRNPGHVVFCCNALNHKTNQEK